MKLIKFLLVNIVLAALTLTARAGLTPNTADCQTSSYTYNNGYCGGVVVPTDYQNTTPNCSGNPTPSVQTAVPEPSTWMAGALVALPLAGTFIRILRQRRSAVE